MFSKEFVSTCGLDFAKMLHKLSGVEKYITSWSISTGNTNIRKSYLAEKIKMECERNFNRAILNYLKKEFNYDRHVEINQPTKNMLRQLKRIGDRPEKFWDAFLKDINVNETL